MLVIDRQAVKNAQKRDLTIKQAIALQKLEAWMDQAESKFASLLDSESEGQFDSRLIELLSDPASRRLALEGAVLSEELISGEHGLGYTELVTAPESACDLNKIDIKSHSNVFAIIDFASALDALRANAPDKFDLAMISAPRDIQKNISFPDLILGVIVGFASVYAFDNELNNHGAHRAWKLMADYCRQYYFALCEALGREFQCLDMGDDAFCSVDEGYNEADYELPEGLQEKLEAL